MMCFVLAAMKGRRCPGAAPGSLESRPPRSPRGEKGLGGAMSPGAAALRAVAGS